VLREAAAGERAGEDLPHRALRREGGILRHVADARPAAQRPHASVGLLDAGQDLEQRRLAGAVGTDQPKALTLADAQRQA
jgi:hypothetical protein